MVGSIVRIPDRSDMASETALTDKTGAPVEVTRRDDDFAIAVDGKTVGLTAFADRDGQRVFFHTEVDDAYGGRGLGTVVISAALAATRDEGLRIVAICPMVAAFVGKHPEYADVVDRTTRETLALAKERIAAR
jgi:predicted GNAT family acetyltransferase